MRQSLRNYVLDANALISLFEARRGSVEKVQKLILEALRKETPLLMSAVNWGEVFYIVLRRHGEDKAREVEAKLQELPVVIVTVDKDRASRAGILKEKYGLGYADAFAAELAIERGAWLVTADPEFARAGRAISICSLPRHEK